MKRQIFAILILAVQMTSGQNYKNYCSNKVCNKCRSYLVRNYRDRTDRLWLMCSALARNDKCCRFESGPTLFTVRDKTGSCVNQPDAHVVEVGYKKYEISECDQNEDPKQISTDILDELGYTDVDSIDFENACANDIGDCVLVSDAIQQLKDEVDQVERLFDTDIRNGSCEIRMNQFESCAVVRQQEMQKKFERRWCLVSGNRILCSIRGPNCGNDEIQAT